MLIAAKEYSKPFDKIDQFSQEPLDCTNEKVKNLAEWFCQEAGELKFLKYIAEVVIDIQAQSTALPSQMKCELTDILVLTNRKGILKIATSLIFHQQSKCLLHPAYESILDPKKDQP